LSIEQVDTDLTYRTGISVILSLYFGHNFRYLDWTCVCARACVRVLHVYHKNCSCGQLRTSRLCYGLQILA